MKLLLDTHAALWLMASDVRLSDRAAGHLIDDSNDVLLSAAVLWEVGVKRALGKLDTPGDIAEVLLGAGARALPISLAHAAEVEHLPAHHRDPFDRLLVAQARLEKAAIVSRDKDLQRYDIDVVW